MQTFTPATLKQLPPDKSVWIVNQLLRTGRKRASLIAGPPEAGKSTLARQLAVAVAQGVPFLGRETVKGKVLYWQSEEDPVDAREDFIETGMLDGDPLVLLHPEPTDDNLVELAKALAHHPDTRLVILETLDDFLKITDIKENSDGRKAFEQFDAVVLSKYAATCSFVCLHWFNKSDSQKTLNINRILGATILAGKTDSKIFVTCDSVNPTRRIIEASVRKGEPIPPTYLDFDSESHTSTLGVTVADEKCKNKLALKGLHDLELDSKITAVIAGSPGLPKVNVKKLVGGKGTITGQRIDQLIAGGDISVTGTREQGTGKINYFLSGTTNLKTQQKKVFRCSLKKPP